MWPTWEIIPCTDLYPVIREKNLHLITPLLKHILVDKKQMQYFFKVFYAYVRGKKIPQGIKAVLIFDGRKMFPTHTTTKLWFNTCIVVDRQMWFLLRSVADISGKIGFNFFFSGLVGWLFYAVPGFLREVSDHLFGWIKDYDKINSIKIWSLTLGHV